MGPLRGLGGMARSSKLSEFAQRLLWAAMAIMETLDWHWNDQLHTHQRQV